VRASVLGNRIDHGRYNKIAHSKIVTIDDCTFPSRQHEVNNIKDYGFSVDCFRPSCLPLFHGTARPTVLWQFPFAACRAL